MEFDKALIVDGQFTPEVDELCGILGASDEKEMSFPTTASSNRRWKPWRADNNLGFRLTRNLVVAAVCKFTDTVGNLAIDIQPLEMCPLRHRLITEGFIVSAQAVAQARDAGFL